MRAQTRVNKKHWPAQWGWPQTALLTDTGTKAVNRVPLSSHTERRMSQCTAALVLCLYSVYSFCPPPLFAAQWGLKSRGSEGGRMAPRSPRQPAADPPVQDSSGGKPGAAVAPTTPPHSSGPLASDLGRSLRAMPPMPPRLRGSLKERTPFISFKSKTTAMWPPAPSLPTVTQFTAAASTKKKNWAWGMESQKPYVPSKGTSMTVAT